MFVGGIWSKQPHLLAIQETYVMGVTKIVIRMSQFIIVQQSQDKYYNIHMDMTYVQNVQKLNINHHQIQHRL